MTAFVNSQEAAFRRIVRDAIRKSSLTKSEQAVVTAVVNLWFHHKASGVMHPGREKIAKRACVSIKTVTRTLAKMADAGCLVVVSHQNGGRAATRYRLRIVPLLALCGARIPEWISGEIVPQPEGEMSRFLKTECPALVKKCPALGGDKMSHGLKDVSQRVSETSSAQVAPSLRLVGGRNA